MQSHITKFASLSKWTSVFLLFLFFNTWQNVHAQSPVSPLESGLKNRVNCSCTDSLGNVYAVTSINLDTTVVNKWSVATKSWSQYAKVAGFYSFSYSSCAILYNKFYITGFDYNLGTYGFFEISGTRKLIGTFKDVVFNVPSNVIKFKNKLYFIGGFDSINNTTKMPGVAVYNGSTFSNAGFPASYVNDGHYFGTGDLNADTLYLAYGDKILKHVAPSTWSIYYQNKEKKTFTSIALNGSILYASIADRLYLFSNGLLKDSILVPVNNKRLSLVSFKNKVYIAALGRGASRVLSTDNTKKIEYGFTNQFTDTNKISFVKTALGLYYHGTTQIKVNGIIYNYIVQVNTDSLNPIGFDTIVGRCFWDRNKNDKYDGIDTAFDNTSFQNLNEGYTLTTQTRGYFKDIVPDNNNVTYRMIGVPTTDSCLRAGYSGNLVSNNLKSGTSVDSLLFPLIRPSKFNTNLVLRSIYRPVSRIDDTVEIVLNVENNDCNFANYNDGEISVTLDSNTTLWGTSPNYSFKVGRTYVFQNLIFNYGALNTIKLKVVYPFGKFKIGDKVRHYASLSPVVGEDSLDNKDSILQRMVYSYDPNAKRSLPEGKITKSMKTIRYFIDFQNEGNDVARRVTVIDTINSKLPAYEYKMVGSSHPYTMSIQPGTNIVKWVFENINLAPKTTDEKASKGYIVFDAKLRGDLKVGDSIRNKASIFFDYNDPVITNYAVVSMVKLDLPGTVQNVPTALNALQIFPNPTQQDFTFRNLESVEQNLAIYDAKGALIGTIYLKAFESKIIDIMQWAKGVYLVVNAEGKGVKLIVQ